MEDTPRADAAAVLTCFTLPGLIAGALVGALTYGDGPRVWTAAAKGGFLGAGSATAVGGLLALALRAGINAPAPA
jgi:hypothetical protein